MLFPTQTACEYTDRQGRLHFYLDYYFQRRHGIHTTILFDTIFSLFFIRTCNVQGNASVRIQTSNNSTVLRVVLVVNIVTFFCFYFFQLQLVK